MPLLAWYCSCRPSRQLANQVLVGGAQQDGELEVVVAQPVAAEVADELAQLDVGDLALADLAREVDVLQDLGQAGVVGLQAAQGAVKEAADIGVGLVNQVLPARRGRHVEGLAVPAFQFGAMCRLGRSLAGDNLLRDDLFAALVEHIGTALEEQHAEDVFLELRGVHLAAQDVGGLEQVAFQLRKG